MIDESSSLHLPAGDDIVANGTAAFVYLDPSDSSYESMQRHLDFWWAKVAPGGGIFAGHDYTAAHSGVPLAVNEFAARNGLDLQLTEVQRKRLDVRGKLIPPCCPSWYFQKP